MPVGLRARLVFPVDGPPIDGGVVTLDGERIVAVGTAAQPGVRVRDLGDVALLPAFVNAHTHLEFSHLTQPLGQRGMRLVEWLPLAIAERQDRGHSAVASIDAGLRECIAAGTCAIGEIATADAASYGEQPSVHLSMLQEVIGFSRARAASAFAALEERFATSQKLFSTGISPHAPYTVSPSLLRMLVLLAQRNDALVAMHLAESEEELELVENGMGPFRELLEERSMWDDTAIPSGTRPLTYMRMLAEAPRSLVVHGNYLAHDEYQFIAEHRNRMSLVFCPRTHAHFNHPPYPLARLLAGGVRVVLGTDSRASNPDLSLLGEMRHVARTHADVSPEDILRMGTLDAADALGIATDYGSITPGKFANLVAIELPGSTTVAATAFGAIFASDASPAVVWLRGQQI